MGSKRAQDGPSQLTPLYKYWFNDVHTQSSMIMVLQIRMVSFYFEGPYPFKHQTSREETEKDIQIVAFGRPERDWLVIYWVWV